MKRLGKGKKKEKEADGATSLVWRTNKRVSHA